ncbi:MAG: fatty acid desaturase [Pseudomonadota bacterium]|nr:fatty acid desaturase [Pseudomonadota bacterium]
MSLMKRFYNDRYLHIRSFTISLVVGALLCVAAYRLHSPDFYRFHFAAWQLLLIPLGIYAGGLSAVFIHNATHDSFPTPWLNWLGGQLAGLQQLWGFMGWKLIHLVHHQYSDHTTMDPHAPLNDNFAQFIKRMFMESSAKITERYRAHWGMGMRTHVLHKALLVVFLGMVACNLLFWYLALGPAGFVFFYIPSYIANHLLFAHINYYCHPKDPATGETAPANLTEHWYYKLANFFWFGIYYHANHHRRPMLFNPRKMTDSRSLPEEIKAAA